MKMFRHTKRVLAKPMDHKTAERELGYKIPNLFYGEEGYLVQELNSQEQKWVPKSVFEDGAVLCDTTNEKLQCVIEDLKDALALLNLYAKEHSPLEETRGKLYVIRRHIQSVTNGINNLIIKEK